MSGAQPNAGAAGEIAVFSILRESKCSECGEELYGGSMLTMYRGAPLCLACSDLGHLVYLGRGDATLTRRARKYSSLSAVVVRFSRSRGRYERQGILVEEAALERAEQECLSDEDRRTVQRARSAERRAEEDRELVERMTQAIRELYPRCPPAEARAIAEHTGRRGSARVGRTAAGRSLDAAALRLAVVAAVRHRHTNYDELLMRGRDRADARAAVAGRIEEVIDRWGG